MQIQKFLTLFEKYEQAKGQVDPEFRDELVKAADKEAYLKELLESAEKFNDEQTFQAVANAMYEHRKPI